MNECGDGLLSFATGRCGMGVFVIHARWSEMPQLPAAIGG